MEQKEYYHTYEEFNNSGLEFLLSHSKAYLRGERTIPVSRSNSVDDFQPVYFTFTNDFLRQFLESPGLLKKPYEVAIKYGFRGSSTGGRNGIFYQSDRLNGISLATQRLASSHAPEISKYLAISTDDINLLDRVKVVWHNPRKERIVGLLNKNNSRIILLDFASY